MPSTHPTTPPTHEKSCFAAEARDLEASLDSASAASGQRSANLESCSSSPYSLVRDHYHHAVGKPAQKWRFRWMMHSGVQPIFSRRENLPPPPLPRGMEIQSVRVGGDYRIDLLASASTTIGIPSSDQISAKQAHPWTKYRVRQGREPTSHFAGIIATGTIWVAVSSFLLL